MLADSDYFFEAIDGNLVRDTVVNVTVCHLIQVGSNRLVFFLFKQRLRFGIVE